MSYHKFKATKEQFLTYVKIRESGETNMMNVTQVIELAKDKNVNINREECLDIQHYFSEYERKYGK